MVQAREDVRQRQQPSRSGTSRRTAVWQLIEARLKHALERQEFVLHYQPRVNLRTGVITGATAMLRWAHPEWGTVAPADYMPIAEEGDLIARIGNWKLRAACAQAKRWNEAGVALESVAVHVAAPAFRQGNFAEGVRAVLSAHRLEPRHLQLNIAASLLARDTGSAARTVGQLKDLGVRLAIDQFAAGCASPGELARLPVDALNLDVSLVNDSGRDAIDGAAVMAMVRLGRSLKLRVVAEGVENRNQLAFLEKLHCKEGQGDYFSAPLPAGRFAALVEIGNAPPMRGHSDALH
jgi:EAL domain-containing protein (putative c-di-GMP-specific phosphodiesterase class I)